jgi:hypothetical protein
MATEESEGSGAGVSESCGEEGVGMCRLQEEWCTAICRFTVLDLWLEVSYK